MSWRRALARTVKQVAATADRLHPPPRGVVVLIYHRVGAGTGAEIDLPVEVFTEQVRELAPRVVPLGDAIAALAGAAPSGPDPVVLTIDDGSADVVAHAVPALADAGAVATLYLATSYVEHQQRLPDGTAPPTWSDLRDAVRTGHLLIGSHTHSHVLLDRLPPSEAAQELDRATKLIEDNLGVTPLDFAYPKAVAPSSEVDALVRARFRSAALAGTRPNRYGATDPFRLARSPVQVSDEMRWFRAKVGGGMALEDGLRRVLNRKRYAGATT